MKIKSLICIFTIICILFTFASCTENGAGNTENPSATANRDPASSNPGNNSNSDDGLEDIIIEGVKITPFDQRDTWGEDAVKINLNGDDVIIDGSGATVDGKKIMINTPGSYVLSGTLNDGQIVVEVDKTEKVQLVLNGASISCSDSATIYVKSADKISLTLVEGTNNTLTDGTNYVFETVGEDKPNGCIYSEEDISINGKGSLTVTGNFNNGIGTKNDLKIIDGNITVTAKNNALKGRDSVIINGGNITVSSDDDGIKSDNEFEDEKGCIYIFAGTVNITAGDDSLQAFTRIKITGGKITTNSQGKDLNCDGEVDVAENVMN